MSILHKGIRRKITAILNDYGSAHYAQNWTFNRVGEIGRRAGLGKSDMASLGGPVILMAFGNFDEPYVVQFDGNGNVITSRVPVIIGGGGGPLFPPPPPPACSLFANKSANGVDTDSVTFTLPVQACASVLTCTGMEAAARRGPAYGYSFVVDGDGVNIGATGCLVDDSQAINIDQGIQTVRVGITGGCNDAGGELGTWSLTLVQ